MAVKVKWKCHVLELNIIFIILSTIFFNEIVGLGPCNHAYPKAHEVIHGVQIDPAHIVHKRSIDQPLRILLWYDESVYRLDNEKFELINNTILPKAVSFWEKALMVRKSENVIRLNRKCENSQVFNIRSTTHCIDSCLSETMCGEVKVPEKHLDVCRICNATGQLCREDPNSVRGPGIDNADFIFYVSAMQTERCNKGLTVAYAAHCQQEAALDRPIAGHANLCPQSISTKPQEMETLLSTVKHEITHALGFSVSLYAYFRDSNGNPLTPRKSDTGKPPLNERLQTYQWSEKVIRTIQRPHWLIRGGVTTRTMHMLVTPKVTAEVRSYFKCNQLEGAELEDQGEDGTALTHWEKRVFENEAMTGTHTQNPVISGITLALMEDTGWYKANYSMAEPMTWGKGLGCDFVMKSCKEWMTIKSSNISDDDNRHFLNDDFYGYESAFHDDEIVADGRGSSIHPFCDKVKRDPLQTGCTDDRTSVALCNLIEHENELPKMYQNFDVIRHVEHGKEGFYGGSVSLADYCPYIQEFTWRSKNISIRGSQCQYSDNTPHIDKNFALETYGKYSKCFEHTDQMWEERSCREVRQWLHWGSGCYEYHCADDRLHIMVANYTYTCYYPGQHLLIRIVRNDWLHKGALICPPCRELCGEFFHKQGRECKPNFEAPPANQYPHDELHCRGHVLLSSPGILLILSLCIIIR